MRLFIRELEDRIVLDAAAVEDAPEPDGTPAPEGPDAAPTREEIVFVEGNARDLVLLAGEAAPDAEVHLLDGGAGGAGQIARVLEGRSGIDAIHVLSHAGEGHLVLGNDVIWNENADRYAEAFRSWSSALSADADILFYGCDVAASQDGQELLSKIAGWTGADVAASTDDTGPAAIGGNLELEHRTGPIETAPLDLGLLDRNLATFTVTNIADAGAGSLRERIAAADASPGPDTIDFAPGVTGSIDLTSGTLAPVEELSILGPGSDVLAIDGLGASQIFNLNLGGGGANFMISGLTLTAGNATLPGPQNGGAIQSFENLTFVDSVVTGCTADGRGGAFDIFGAGAGLTVRNSTFNGNVGLAGSGGISVDSTGLPVTVENSTFNINVAVGAGGGGMSVENPGAAVVIRNSTFSDNISTFDGGGLFVGTSNDLVTVRNSTFALNDAFNNGGGIAIDTGDLVLQSTIVGTNTAGTNNDLNSANPGDAFMISNTLIQTPGTATVIETVPGSNIFGRDPLLGPLAPNGGPTETHALLDGSPALDTGSNPGGLATDQRGPGFARVSGPAADIGAFERQVPSSAAQATPGAPLQDPVSLDFFLKQLSSRPGQEQTPVGSFPIQTLLGSHVLEFGESRLGHMIDTAALQGLKRSVDAETTEFEFHHEGKTYRLRFIPSPFLGVTATGYEVPATRPPSEGEDFSSEYPVPPATASAPDRYSDSTGTTSGSSTHLSPPPWLDEIRMEDHREWVLVDDDEFRDCIFEYGELRVRYEMFQSAYDRGVYGDAGKDAMERQMAALRAKIEDAMNRAKERQPGVTFPKPPWEGR